MSKYQIKAQPGSFGAGQVKATKTKVDRIREKAAYEDAGLQAAQKQQARNNELGLRAQMFNQQTEQQSRELAFDLDMENRKLYQESEQMNYNIQIQNEENRLKEVTDFHAKLKDFSASAATFVGDTIQNQKDKRRSAYNATILQYGLTLDDRLAVNNLDKNLTTSEFLKTNLGIEMLKDGYSPEKIDAIVKLFINDSGSHAYINNINFANSEFRKIESLLAKEASLFDANDSVEHKKATIEGKVKDYLGELTDEKGNYFRGEFLEQSINKKVRDLVNEYNDKYDKEKLEDNIADLRNASLNVISKAIDDGTMMTLLSKDPSAKERVYEVIKNRLNSGTLEPDKAEAFLNSKLVNYAGGDKTFREAFGIADSQVGEIVKLINTTRRTKKAGDTAKASNDIAETNNDLLIMGNQFAVEGDGYITADEFAQIEEAAVQSGHDPSKLDALERLRKLSIPAQVREKSLELIQKDYNEGNLTVAKLKSYGLSEKDVGTWMSRAMHEQNIRTNSESKRHVNDIKGVFLHNGALVARGTNKGPSSTYMQNKYVTMWRKDTLREQARLADAGIVEDYAVTAERTKAGVQQKALDFVNNPLNINTRTMEFIEWENQVSNLSEELREGIEFRQKMDSVLGDPQGASFKKLSEVLDQENFIEYHNNTATTQGIASPIASLINRSVPSLNLTDLEMHNKLAEQFDLEPVVPGNDIKERIKESLDPITHRFYTTDPKISQRANYMISGGPPPIRSALAATRQSQVLPQNQWESIGLEVGFTPEEARVMAAIIMGESGGNATDDTVQSGLDPNKEREYSIGGPQINVQAHMDKLERRGFTEDDLRDPRKAMIIAKEVFDEAGGFTPWSVYNKGIYEQFLN